MKKTKFKSNIVGVCPFCNGKWLEYDAVSFEGDMLYFPWACHDCGNKGQEWYSLDFTGHNAWVDHELTVIEDVFVGENNENE